MNRRTMARAGFRMLCVLMSALAFQHITWGALWTRAAFALMAVAVTAALTAVVSAVVWEPRAAGLCSYGLACLSAYAYECVWLFRGAAFKPMDVVNLSTGLTVAGAYVFPFTGKHAFWLACGAALALLAHWTPGGRSRWRTRLACLAAALGWLAVLLLTPLLDWMGAESTAYEADAKRINTRYGTLPTLVFETRQLLKSYPAGYDPALLGSALPELTERRVTGGSERPNVVVIVSESLMEPARLWQLDVSEDPMPFLSHWENTVRGHLYVSAYGGKTSDTEHCFLTGTAPAPDSAQPLLATVKRTTPSLAWQLKALGYRTLAIHPFIRDNYQRPVMYPRLGFDDYLSEEAFAGAERLRSYVSDRACYERIMQAFREKSGEERLFVYAVTMQNHGPYPDALDEEPIRVAGEESHPELKTYLNLLRHSDEALQRLAGFLQQQEEPTVVLLFGDHQARLSFDGYEPAENLTELEQTLNAYVTPFVLWSNQPMRDEWVEALSVNYLQALLLQKAGLPMTAYDEWCLRTAESYPVVLASGWADSRGVFTAWNAGEAPAALETMNQLRYNRLYDTENRLAGLDALLNGTEKSR